MAKTIIDQPLTAKQREAVDAVARCNGNIAAAARMLGVSYGTFRVSVRAAWTKLAHQDGAEARGRAAYEEDVRRWPRYHDGQPRKAWDELDDVARWSWIRDPRPRDLCRRKMNEDER